QKKELTESIRREATALLYKAESLANSIQAAIETSEEQDQNRLRAVLNSLFDSRLKLERAIFRFGNRKDSDAEEAPSETEAQPQAAPKKKGMLARLFGR